MCGQVLLSASLNILCATAAFEFLESIAYAGIALNLVVYLGTVLHMQQMLIPGTVPRFSHRFLEHFLLIHAGESTRQ
jgi:hypothetical protein